MNNSLNKLSEQYSINLDEFNDIYPVPVGDISDKLGIELQFDKSMTDKQSGKIQYENNKYIITVNDNKSYYHTVFTIAHELGHYCCHQNKVQTEGFIERKQTQYTDDQMICEQQANQFAAELLMPECKFKEIFNKNNQILEEVQKFFQVSLKAVEFRAINLGLTLMA